MWLLLIEPERAFSELLTLLQSPEPTEQFYAVDQVVDVFAQISGRAPLFGNRPLLREQDVTHFGAVIRAKRLEIGIRLAAMMRIAKAKSDLRRHAALALYLLFEDDHNLLRIALRDVDVLREVGLVSG
jgi:hypothetical protein